MIERVNSFADKLIWTGLKMIIVAIVLMIVIYYFL